MIPRGSGRAQKKRKADAFPKLVRVPVVPSGVSESVEIDCRSRGSSGVGGRSSRSFPSRVRDGLSLLGVALTFSVSQPDVATRLASRLRLRPLRLATWTLASSAELRPVGIPSRFGTTHGLAFALEDRLLFSVRASAAPSDGRDLFTNLLLWGLSPLRRSQPGESTSRLRLPGARCHAPAHCRNLVAGLHTRFGPPPPFLTTLTASASPSPVAYFSHSRPWGSFSLFPASLPYHQPSEDDP